MNYDFLICKACKEPAGELKYHLSNAKVYVCRQCGFHYTNYLDPVDSIVHDVNHEALTQEKKNYIETQLQSNVERTDRHVSLLQERFDLRGKRVLDIGCGGGLFLSKVRDAGAEVFGIELDDARVRYATEVHDLNVVKYHVEHEYWQNDHVESFDVITLWDVIEHVNFPIDTLKAAARLLKPGGLLVLDTPVRDAFYHQIGATTYQLSAGKFPTFLNALYANQTFGHKQIISRKEIARFFQHASLDLVGLQMIHELTFPYRFYLRKLMRSNLLVEVAHPFVVGFFKLVKIRNKMIVVGQRTVV